MASSLQSQIDSVQKQLDTANYNFSKATADAKDACGNKDGCSWWIPYSPACYSDTGNKDDQKDKNLCATSTANIATYQGQVTALATQLNGLKAQLKNQGGASSITKKVIIWTLVLIAVGLTVFFVGRHYKKW